MLRITIQQGADGVRFRLEGKVSGPWVDELERSWYEASDAANGAIILVDLTEVTFVDIEGKKVLGWMYDRGAKFLCTGCMTKGIVEEIRRERESAGRERLGSGRTR